MWDKEKITSSFKADGHNDPIMLKKDKIIEENYSCYNALWNW